MDILKGTRKVDSRLRDGEEESLAALDCQSIEGVRMDGTKFQISERVYAFDQELASTREHTKELLADRKERLANEITEKLFDSINTSFPDKKSFSEHASKDMRYWDCRNPLILDDLTKDLDFTHFEYGRSTALDDVAKSGAWDRASFVDDLMSLVEARLRAKLVEFYDSEDTNYKGLLLLEVKFVKQENGVVGIMVKMRSKNGGLTGGTILC